MQRLFASIFLLTIIYTNGVAQTPQYKCTKFTGSSTGIPNFGFTGIEVKYQSIYQPSDFASIPAGRNLSAIYLRVGRTYGYTAPAVYNYLTVKIGYTTDSGFNYGAVYDTFKSGLTTILDVPSFTVQGSDTIAKWIKVPIDPQTSFTYDKTKMLVVEVAMGPKPNNTGFDLMASNNTGQQYKCRTIGAHRDSARIYGNYYGSYLDLGIDLRPAASVGGPSNITELKLYPNPGRGLVSVALSSQKPVKGVRITVTAMNGAQAFSRGYGPGSKTFRTELDLRHLAKGAYNVLIDADGELMSRNIVLE